MSTFTTSIAVLLVLAVVAGFFLWRYKRAHPKGYAEHEADLLREWDRLHPKPYDAPKPTDQTDVPNPRPTPVVVPYVPPVDPAPPAPSTKYEDWINAFGPLNGSPGWVIDRWRAEHTSPAPVTPASPKPPVAQPGGPAIATGLKLPEVGKPVSNPLKVGMVYDFTFNYVGWAGVEWSETTGTNRNALISAELNGVHKSSMAQLGLITALCSGPSVARLTTNVDTQLMCVLRAAQAPKAPR